MQQLLSQHLSRGLCIVLLTSKPQGKEAWIQADTRPSLCCYVVSLDLSKQAETEVPETHPSQAVGL